MFLGSRCSLIGYQHDAVLIAYLYVSDSEIVGRATQVVRCNARRGAHDPREQLYIYNFYRQCSYFLVIGGRAKYFLF